MAILQQQSHQLSPSETWQISHKAQWTSYDPGSSDETGLKTQQK